MKECSSMNRNRVASFAATALVVLSACSGGSMPHASGGLPPVPGNPPTHRGTHARLLVKVLPQKHRKKMRVRGHYVSPATASLTYTVSPPLAGGASYGEIDINTSNPDCQTTGVIGYLTCSLDIDGIVPGTPYVFGLTTWDAAGGNGNKLSANDTVPFTATAGAANVVQATLGGIATSFAVVPMTSARMTGSSARFTVYGNDPVKFGVVGVDADDNFIIGPGAPQPSVSASGGAPMAVATVGPNAPNEWTLTSTYAPADPSVPSSASLAISATPVPGSGAATINATVPIELYQPWIYLMDGGTYTVRAYDEDGNTIPQFAPIQLPLEGNAPAIAFGNHRIYAYGGAYTGASNYLAAYPPAGGPAITTVTSTTIPALANANVPGQLMYDPSNGQLYTQDDSDGLIMSFDGALTENISSISNGSSGMGMAYVPSRQQVIADVSGQLMNTCDEGLSACPNIQVFYLGYGVAYDPNQDQIGVCSVYGNFQLRGYSGANLGMFGPDNGCDAVTFDRGTAHWYIGITGAPYVSVFAENGTQLAAGAFSGITGMVHSIVSVP
jgi:hypothetical protein